MSFRRHYGTGSYSSSLLSSPLTSNYGSRGLGGYNSSSYSTPHAYTPSYSSYGGYGGKSSALSRSASLPRDARDRAVQRLNFSRGSSPSRSAFTSSYSRSTSPTRSFTITSPSRVEVDLSDSSSSSGDLPSTSLYRHHSFSGGRSSVLPVTPRAYSKDYGTHYSTSKGFVRSSRSKSLGSTGSISSLSSGYCSGSANEHGETVKGSTTSLGSAINSRPSSRSSSVGPENGDIDYKKLYEEQLEENFRVHERLRGTENELRQTREAIDLNNKKCNTRLAMAEADKREKRALERKLSEMEEELKLLEQLKQENQRLKDENGALIRVISKLSK